MNEKIDKAVNQFLNQTVAIFPEYVDTSKDDALVLGFIWSKVQTKKEYNPNSRYFNVTICKDEWKRAFGDSYKKKYDRVAEMGFIDYSGYSNGGEKSFCRDFWLTRQFWDTPNVKKILPLKQRIKQPISGAKTLSKFANKTKIGIPALDPLVSSNLSNAMASLSFDEGIIKTLKKKDGITPENLTKSQSSLRNFHLKEFWYSRSEAGRLYSSITLMPKVFRRHLMMNGKPLVEIDIKAAQLTIIASLYDKWVIACSDNENEAREEKIRYNEVLLNKDIYTDIFDNLCGGDREKIKTTISTWLNGGVLYVSICDMLGKHFPLLANFLSKQTIYPIELTLCPLSNTPLDKGIGKQIMEIESEIMIENIFNVHSYEFPLITIHDAVLVEKEHVETINNAIKDEFKKKIGIEPLTTIE